MVPDHWESYRFDLVEISKGAALKRFRQSIKDEWGCCAYCGSDKDDKGVKIDLTIDHLKPKAFGGSSLRTNLVPACLPCNSAKGSNRDWLVWYREQTFYCSKKADRIKKWITPLNNDLFDLWCLSGAIHYEPRANDGAGVSAAQDRTRDQELLEGGFNRGIVRLLGGEIQTEASLSFG